MKSLTRAELEARLRVLDGVAPGPHPGARDYTLAVSHIDLSLMKTYFVRCKRVRAARHAFHAAAFVRKAEQEAKFEAAMRRPGGFRYAAIPPSATTCVQTSDEAWGAVQIVVNETPEYALVSVIWLLPDMLWGTCYPELLGPPVVVTRSDRWTGCTYHDEHVLAVTVGRHAWEYMDAATAEFRRNPPGAYSADDTRHWSFWTQGGGGTVCAHGGHVQLTLSVDAKRVLRHIHAHPLSMVAPGGTLFKQTFGCGDDARVAAWVARLRDDKAGAQQSEQ